MKYVRVRSLGWVVVAAVLTSLLVPVDAQAGTAILTPSKDNSLYEDPSGSLSNGAGADLFTGRTFQPANRRALLAFDVAAGIPAGATIDSVTLTMFMQQTLSVPNDVSLHSLLVDWGEGASVAPGQGGSGAPAAAGDATWLHTFFSTSFWTSPGGDFVAAPSATVTAGGFGSYTWASTPGLVADVQNWLDNPASNFGWIAVGDETTTPTARRWASRENGDASVRPMLTVEYTAGGGAVCGNGVVEAGEQCDDGNTTSGDGCSSTCQAEGAVPTVSEWGLIIMSLLLLMLASIVFGRRFAMVRTR